ncbi:MAG TPA: hypothetical protein VH475_04495 [Tepidisphaeraceae bacterium]
MRLNVFQQVMRLWDRVHPYNAAQVLHVRGRADVDRIGRAWARTLEVLGLGRVRVSGDAFAHDACDPRTAADAVRVVDGGVTLAEHVSGEMNRPFDEGVEDDQPVCPFRPFVLRQADSHDLGLVYHHWVADSASIRLLLREWFYRIHEPARARSVPVESPRGGYWHHFGPSRGRWSLGEGFLSALRMTTRLCNARRVERPLADYRVRCEVHPLPDGMIGQIREAARQLGATVNDVFLAAMAEACHRYGATPPGRSRQELALGTVVDLRPSCGDDLDDVFGLFLGFTTVVVRPDVLRDWPALVRAIAGQNAWQKQVKVAEASQLRMAAAVAESRLMSLETWVRFYLRHLPLAGGISNVNLCRSWAAEYHPQVILDYLRFSPTGPALPILFTPSSLGERSHVALTYRPALIGDERAARIVATFIQRLRSLAESTSASRMAVCDSAPDLIGSARD